MPAHEFSWPCELIDQEIKLRSIKRRDRRAWVKLRDRNDAYLKPWEATLPPAAGEHGISSFKSLTRFLSRGVKQGTLIPFVIEVNGKLSGQITLAGITYGPLRSGQIGYWLDETLTRKGITTRAVKMISTYAFSVLKLHRLEIAVRPENYASTRVAEKAGFTFEGMRASYVHIDGAWRDHSIYFLINQRDVK